MAPITGMLTVEELEQRAPKCVERHSRRVARGNGYRLDDTIRTDASYSSRLFRVHRQTSNAVSTARWAGTVEGLRAILLLANVIGAAGNVHFANYGVATLNTLAFFLILVDWRRSQ